MTSKNKLSYLQRDKGKYAYTTGNRVFVWKNIIWPLLLEVNRPWFTLKEYASVTEHLNPREQAVMWMDKNDVRCVKCSSNGKISGVPAVVID